MQPHQPRSAPTGPGWEINTQSRKDTKQQYGTSWNALNGELLLKACRKTAVRPRVMARVRREHRVAFCEWVCFASRRSTLHIQYRSAQYTMYTLRLANGHVRPAWCCKIVVEACYSTWLEGVTNLDALQWQNTQTHTFLDACI